MSNAQPSVVSVNLQGKHQFSKEPAEQITLIPGFGIEDDAHAGATVQHLSRVRKDPSQPNLRQVHLMHAELFDELAGHGFEVKPGNLGENVTTRGIDLLGLPTGTRLRLGTTAEIEVTGLRNPCVQIEKFQPGLLKQVLGHDEGGNVVRRAGIMAVVLHGGSVAADDSIAIQLPAEPHSALEPV